MSAPGNAAWSRHLDLTSQRPDLVDELRDLLVALPGSGEALGRLELLSDLVDASDRAAYECVSEMQSALDKP